MKFFVKSAAAAAIVSACFSAGAQNAAHPFFKPWINGCSYEKPVDDALQSLCQFNKKWGQKGQDFCLASMPRMPSGLEGAFSESLSAKNHGDYTDIEALGDGKGIQLAGMKARGIQRLFGHENGINAWGVLLEAPSPAAAAKKVAAAGIRFKSVRNEAFDYMQKAEFAPDKKGRGVWLMCNLSD